MQKFRNGTIVRNKNKRSVYYNQKGKIAYTEVSTTAQSYRYKIYYLNGGSSLVPESLVEIVSDLPKEGREDKWI